MTDPSLFASLAGLLRPYSGRLFVKSDTDSNFYLEESQSTGKPQMFAAVQAKKGYVALHLFPVYVKPELLESISPTLRSRMHGKSCFNFKREDQVPRDELAHLIERAHDSLTP